MLNLTWRVVVGEESQEVDVENQREMRVFEAVYPRASAIPPKLITSFALCNSVLALAFLLFIILNNHLVCIHTALL